MARMTTADLANEINSLCNGFNYFYAYGLVKETVKLWSNDRIVLLCDDAQIMVGQVKEAAQ